MNYIEYVLIILKFLVLPEVGWEVGFELCWDVGFVVGSVVGFVVGWDVGFDVGWAQNGFRIRV